ESIALHLNFDPHPVELRIDPGTEVLFSHALGPAPTPGHWTLLRAGVLFAVERGR
ncbi:MAG: hypothetical protein IT508_11860, partial [Burkholderiaceae bacterium]|nr:hypothetical protein [Burkholderiaceae bacterium]